MDSSRPLTVLLADDNLDDLFVLRHNLQRDDPRRYQVHTAETGDEVLRHCRASPPDCLLLDHELPDMNSLEVLKALEEQAAGAMIPVIVLTGRGDEALAVASISAGAQDFLVKDSLTPELLHRTIRVAREQLRLRTELQASEARYRLLFEGSPTPAWVIDRETLAFLEANDAAVEVYGYTREELLGMTIMDIRPRADVPRLRERLGQTLPRGSGHRVAALHRTRDGKLMDVEISWRDVDVGGQRRRLVAAHDVTARVRAAKREQAARELAERTVALRDEFLTIAAHELKTPITVLRGQSQLNLRRLAREDTVSADTVAASFRTIDEQSRKLQRLVEQLLDLSRIETGRLELECADADLSALLEQAVEHARLRAEGRRILLEAPIGMVAHVDALRVEQMVSNLLDNALKYGPADQPIRVSLREMAEDRPARAVTPTANVDQRRSIVEIAVRDYGRGIPELDRERIFERFEQVHPNDHVRGFGLGLYVCKQIVQLHGGTIDAESPDGGGTRVVVRLPRVGAAAYA